jgi:beta-glucosidase
MRRSFDLMRWVAAMAAVMLAGGALRSRAADRPALPAGIPALPPPYATWPHVDSAIPKDPALEARIAQIVAGMTLEEKVGQMTQPDAHLISPADVRKYHIGTVLSGGGGWPNGDKRAPASAWLAMADALWDASMSTDSKVKIPILWGIDAVHGHARPFGTTVFPHHIGLGAAHDPDLVRRLAAATAAQMRVTGHDWTFSPCVAVVRDDRWGRTYESWSEDPAIVRAYAAAEVAGLQNLTATPDGKKPYGVLATAKHFLGDGGTAKGSDQGPNLAPEAELINIHGQGYYGAIGAGVQTVMPSFNSWLDPKKGIGASPAAMAEGKIHGSKYLISDVLEGKLGFDGFVVSDWKGENQVPGCTTTRCARAINAGIDVMMVADEWKGFYEDTIALVKKGEIPMARIDDAVTRILRVKLRMGLFDMPKPSQRPGAKDAARLQAKALAAEAVQKSLVLLKNDGHVLPLKPAGKILVVGKSANSVGNQTGGWTLTWQGDQNVNDDFPGASTVLAGVKRLVGDQHVTYSERGDGVSPADFDAVVAVIGETPYVEFTGDLMPGNPNVRGARRTMEHAVLYPEDLAVLDKVSGKGKPVVTVFISGRPLYTNKELNRSSAFVAAWLPGTEAGAIADVLFAEADGKPRKDFSGKLSFSWPKADCQQPLNAGDASYDPLFPFGFGQSYAAAGAPDLGKLPEPASLKCD